MKITAEEIIELVKQMRIAQKEYFSSRSGASLSKSKNLERAVDHAISEYFNPNLFS